MRVPSLFQDEELCAHCQGVPSHVRVVRVSHRVDKSDPLTSLDARNARPARGSENTPRV